MVRLTYRRKNNPAAQKDRPHNGRRGRKSHRGNGKTQPGDFYILARQYDCPDDAAYW